MPLQIGAKAHSFSDPTGLLWGCHRRIEMFLGSLQRVADVIDRPLTEEARSALESALRYFRDSAPKHTADEEESLFPRLMQIQDPEIENALASLDALEADHHQANTLHGEVDVLGTRCLEEHRLPGTEAAQFRQTVNKVASIYGEPSQLSSFHASKLATWDSFRRWCGSRKRDRSESRPGRAD